MADNPLGKPTVYPLAYSPALLAPIPRRDNRMQLGLDTGPLPFQGADVWNAYEISCLDPRGKPMVFMGRFVFPCTSPNLVESKSLKLYLNSLNQRAFDSVNALGETVAADLAGASGSEVAVSLLPPEQTALPEGAGGLCLDGLDIDIDCYAVNPQLLLPDEDSLYTELVDEVLYTHLFRSNCPVTGQPDWATVTVCYRGRKIPPAALLRYLVSYRQHNDYHENCVERIFCDIQSICKPDALTVEANFLRRGGLDINPVRTSSDNLDYLAFPRHIRQ